MCVVESDASEVVMLDQVASEIDMIIDDAYTYQC